MIHRLVGDVDGAHHIALPLAVPGSGQAAAQPLTPANPHMPMPARHGKLLMSAASQ